MTGKSARTIRTQFAEIIDEHQAIGTGELRRLFAEALRAHETTAGWDQSSKGKPWTDDELRVVLSDAPTKENCLKHARAFGRGYGALEQIYRWAATPDATISAKGRSEDNFISQVKRVAKEMGWRV